MIGNYWESSNTEGTQKSKNVKVCFSFLFAQSKRRFVTLLLFILPVAKRHGVMMGEIILVDVKDALSSRLWNLKAPYTQFEMRYT